MWALIRAALAWLLLLISRFFGDWRKFFIGGFILFLGAGLYSLQVSALSEISAFMAERIGDINTPGGSESLTYSVTGFAGWLLSTLKIPQCIAFIVTSVIIRYQLKIVSGMMGWSRII